MYYCLIPAHHDEACGYINGRLYKKTTPLQGLYGRQDTRLFIYGYYTKILVTVNHEEYPQSSKSVDSLEWKDYYDLNPSTSWDMFRLN